MPGLALLILITVALGFEFINGFHDTANAIAVSIHTGALSCGRAVALAAVMNLLGAFASENVARTISGELISAAIDEYTIIAALIAAIIWNLFTWYLGMPASSSHALIGALIGAAVVFTGSTDAVLWKNVVLKVVLPLFLCPPAGFAAGALASLVIKKENRIMQIAASAFVAFSHGENDAQKTMGIITLALAGRGILCDNDSIPPVIKIVCALAIAAGTSIGGFRIIDTMGRGLVRLEKTTGLAAQLSSALVIQAASAAGIPASTTQIVTASIMGAGRKQRQKTAKPVFVLLFWLMTMPVCAFSAGVIMAAIRYI